MEATLDGRLYNIQNDVYHYHTGLLENGNQVLMGVQLPELVMVEFNPEGHFVELAARDISGKLQRYNCGLYELDDDMLLVELRIWQSEIGLTPSTISVREFFFPDRWIGIKDIPEHYQDVIERPEDYDEERRRQLQDDIREWSEDGSFVLYWNEDYYLSKEGELESS